jgi:putative DNA primase/helicase
LGGAAISRSVLLQKPEKRSKADDPDAQSRLALAHRLWSEGLSIKNTPAQTYFERHRKLDVRSLDLDHTLRWHPRAHAVIARMIDPVSGQARGVHRTFLGSSAEKINRKMLGPAGVVAIASFDMVTLGIGLTEGIEDGIAVILSGWQPIWAATSAGAISRFPVLQGVDALTIFADADPPGMRAAEACQEVWRAAGCEVVIAEPRRLA